jgi:hypothetical protein
MGDGRGPRRRPVWPQSPSVAGAATDLQFVERSCGDQATHCAFVDERHDGFGSCGDRFVFTLPLVSRDDGARLGREQGECVLLHQQSDTFYCTLSVHLEGGSLSVKGTFEQNRHTSAIAPITGGTGQYEGADGSFTQTGRNIDLHILTP